MMRISKKDSIIMALTKNQLKNLQGFFNFCVKL